MDDLYMLLGKAYFLRQDFDSAYRVFQYLNYIYAPKDDGYDIPIGSNSSNANGIFSISTNEKDIHLAGLESRSSKFAEYYRHFCSYFI